MRGMRIQRGRTTIKIRGSPSFLTFHRDGERNDHWVRSPLVSCGWFGTVWGGGQQGDYSYAASLQVIFFFVEKNPYRMERELFIPPFLLGPKGSIARRYEIPSGPQVFLHNAPEKGKRSLRRGFLLCAAHNHQLLFFSSPSMP